MVSQACTPFGITASQTWEQLTAYLRAVHELDVKLFVELGIHKGGLAALMIARTHWVDFRYLGIEIAPRHIDERVIKRDGGPVRIWYGDCLGEAIKKQVSDAIHDTQGVVFVLCDNGNKPAEMKTYAPLLRLGDYIAAHDYPLEITDKDLRAMDNSPDFEQVNPDRWRYGVHVPLYKRVT